MCILECTYYYKSIIITTTTIISILSLRFFLLLHVYVHTANCVLIVITSNNNII